MNNIEPNIKTAELLISLLRAALRGSKLTESPSDPDILESVYRLAKFHSVDAAAYYGIVGNDIDLPEELQKKWSGSRNLNIAKTVHEAHERDNIYSLFSQSGTDYLPLKGLLIKPMYPAPEYRQMADLDILVREEQLEQAGRLLEENGYRCVRSGDTHHDSFLSHLTYRSNCIMRWWIRAILCTTGTTRIYGKRLIRLKTGNMNTV